MSEDTATIIFQPSGRRGEVPKGITLIEASRKLGVDIEALCGEKKVCGKCIVRVEEGFYEKYGITSSMDHTSEWQEEEDKFINAENKAKGLRLGCVAKVEGDMLIFVPEESRAGKQVVSKAARDIGIEWNPAVRVYYVQVDPPTFEEPTGDFERVCRGLEREFGLTNLTADVFALRQLPHALRDGDWSVTVSVWNNREVIRFRPGKHEKAYGIAIDIGTTTCAAYFCDLTTMEVIDTVSMMNPQCKYGEDVMARITFHMMNEDGLKRMSDDIIEGINELIDKAIAGTYPPKKKKKKKKGEKDAPDEYVEAPEEGKTYLRLTRDDIEDITLGGNTAMHHILLQLDPEFVGLAPFPPVLHHSMDIKCRDLGINITPSAYVFVLSIEAGFVGADNVGVLIAEEPYKGDENQLIIDIGTNGELVLGNRHKLISSSCATGPALEGAQLSFGMRAAPGAIERIEIDPETHEVDYKVIGRDAFRKFSKPEEMGAKGICGSGILDVLAELYRSGVINKTGVFNKEQKSNRTRKNPDTKQPEFVLAWKEESSIEKDIVITQKDVRQIQLAKGALYAGCKLMVRRMGLDNPDCVKIAGAFGTHVDREKALIMGLFPDCPIDMIQGVGNAAGDGCRAALLNVQKRVESDWCSRNVEYIELTVEDDFQQQFMEAMQLPHMTDEFPHLEGLVPPEILHQMKDQIVPKDTHMK
jgi:uncharacterized 2Fe-2S/4Fe-4S cluster protein (DUF4445 family)